jgi:hypothetical protein
VKKENNATSIIHGNAIDLKMLDIKPINIFFYPDEDHTDYQRQIFVKTLSSKTIAITIGNRDAVFNIKLALQQLEGIPPHQQRLIYNGKELADRTKISDLDQDATVHLVLRILGGSDSIASSETPRQIAKEDPWEEITQF